MKNFKKVITLLSLLFVLDANAGLTLTFDTANETFSFSGNQTVGGGTYEWGTFTGSGSLLFFSAPQVSGASGDAVETNDNGLYVSITGIGNLVGTGSALSYSTATSGQKTYITTLNGSTLSSNNSLDPINIAVVPEPSQYAALCGAALLVFGVLKRRKDKMGGLGKLSCESSTNIG